MLGLHDDASQDLATPTSIGKGSHSVAVSIQLVGMLWFSLAWIRPAQLIHRQRISFTSCLKCSIFFQAEMWKMNENEMLIFLHNSHPRSMLSLLSSQGKVTMSSSVEMQNNQVTS